LTEFSPPRILKLYAQLLGAPPDVLLYAGPGVWVVWPRFSHTHP